MTHYYLYISCGTSLNDDARFYKVAIGTSAKETRFHAFLESYAIEHGHFFVLWDSDAIGFLNRCLESVNKTLSQVTTCTGKDLCNYFKGVTGYPYSLTANLQRHDLLKRIDPAYYAICQLRRRK